MYTLQHKKNWENFNSSHDLYFDLFGLVKASRILLSFATDEQFGTSCLQLLWSLKGLSTVKASTPPSVHLPILLIKTNLPFQTQSDTSRRQQSWLPPCPMVTALVLFKCSRRNLQFAHRVPLTKEKMHWCPSPFKKQHTGLQTTS